MQIYRSWVHKEIDCMIGIGCAADNKENTRRQTVPSGSLAYMGGAMASRDDSHTFLDESSPFH